MVDIVPETINRIRLSDKELILLDSLLSKIDENKLSEEERIFYKILTGRIKGRLTLKKDPRIK